MEYAGKELWAGELELELQAVNGEWDFTWAESLRIQSWRARTVYFLKEL